jgi:hypothetical protein
MVISKTTYLWVILIAFLALGIGIVSADMRIIPASMTEGPFTEFRLTTDDAVTNAQYGRSVAIDGDLVAVGMGGDGSVGAVYLYKRQGNVYLLEAKLVFPDPLPGTCNGITGTCPEFGRTVAIKGDTVFVGARFAPVNGVNAGAVYVFQKQGDLWQLEDKIVSPTPEEEDNFGRALAIQGNLLVVTARKNSAEKGAVYVYSNKLGRWIHKETLVASDSADGDYFGQSVALQGSFMVIGARNTANSDGVHAGGFYLFHQSGNNWLEVTKVTPTSGKEDDQYGFAIAIHGDTIVVTARRADPAGSKNAGAAYIYSLKGNSVSHITTLTPSDASSGDEFGQSVAFADNVIAVGAWKDDIRQGSVYLFRQKGGQWIEAGRITASDGRAGDEFGYSLAAIGNRMVTGAHTADFISTDGGAAYVLSLESRPIEG